MYIVRVVTIFFSNSQAGSSNIYMHKFDSINATTEIKIIIVPAAITNIHTKRPEFLRSTIIAVCPERSKTIESAM